MADQMDDPIAGIFGPSAQEKMRAQTLALASRAQNPFVMRNIMREGAANAKTQILHEAETAGIDIAKDPVAFADSAIHTMMTQKYPGYERDAATRCSCYNGSSCRKRTSAALPSRRRPLRRRPGRAA